MARGGGDDNPVNSEMLYLCVILLVIFIVYLIWTFARPIVVYVSFTLDLIQIFILEKIMPFTATSAGLYEVAKAPFALSDHLPREELDLNRIRFDVLKDVSGLAGYGARWVITPAIAAMGLWCLFRMKGAGASHNFSLAGGEGKGPSLAHYQAKEWKVITPGAQFDPDALVAAEMPAMTPMEWMQEHKVSLTEAEGLDYDAAQSAFAAQLGAQWEGVEKAAPIIKAVALLCFLNGARAKNPENKKEDYVRRMKEDFAVKWSTATREEAEAFTLAAFEKVKSQDPRLVRVVDKVAEHHAWANTAMFKLLWWARREGGVFASAEIRWLKPFDRTLWYTLNNCGRRAFLIEAAGAVSHYHAEHILKTPLFEPHVDQAVDGLQDYIDEQGIMDLDEFFNGNKSLL